MLKKSLLLASLFTLNPFVTAEEQTTNEEVSAQQEEINTWSMGFSFKASNCSQENWDIIVEKINTTLNWASEENSDINPIEATINLLNDLFTLSTNNEDFTPADSDKTAVVSFTMNKLNNDDLTSWENAHNIAQTIANDLNNTGTISFEQLAPSLRELISIIDNSESLQGNISIGFTQDNAEEAVSEENIAE